MCFWGIKRAEKYLHDVHVDDAVAVADFAIRNSGGGCEWDRKLLVEAVVDQSSFPLSAAFQPRHVAKHIVFID